MSINERGKMALFATFLGFQVAVGVVTGNAEVLNTAGELRDAMQEQLENKDKTESTIEDARTANAFEANIPGEIYNSGESADVTTGALGGDIAFDAGVPVSAEAGPPGPAASVGSTGSSSTLGGSTADSSADMSTASEGTDTAFDAGVPAASSSSAGTGSGTSTSGPTLAELVGGVDTDAAYGARSGPGTDPYANTPSAQTDTGASAQSGADTSASAQSGADTGASAQSGAAGGQSGSNSTLDSGVPTNADVGKGAGTSSGTSDPTLADLVGGVDTDADYGSGYGSGSELSTGSGADASAGTSADASTGGDAGYDAGVPTDSGGGGGEADSSADAGPDV